MFRQGRFGHGRRFPLRGLALIGLGILLASTWGSAGSAIGWLLVLPLLMLKFFFIMFLVGMAFRFFGGRGRSGRGPGGPWGRWDGSGARGWSPRDRGDDGSEWWYRGRPMGRPAPGPFEPEDIERRDWEESLRQARREVDDLDRPGRRVDDLDRPGRRVDDLDRPRPRVDDLDRPGRRVDDLDRPGRRVDDLDRPRPRVDDYDGSTR